MLESEFTHKYGLDPEMKFGIPKTHLDSLI
jgi:hypothetical protein